MKTPLKHSMLTASLVLVGATALGCGGGGAPTDASEKEFCANLNSLFEDLGSMADASEQEAIATIKTWGEDLEKVGTPESISDEGREGFEVVVEQVAALDEDDTTEDFDKLEEDLSDSEKKASEAFEKYTADTCGELGAETPEVPAPS